MYCGTSEGSSTDEPGCGKSQQDDVLAQVKGLLTEAVSSQSLEGWKKREMCRTRTSPNLI